MAAREVNDRLAREGDDAAMISMGSPANEFISRWQP
jgi:hypothetical protein